MSVWTPRTIWHCEPRRLEAPALPGYHGCYLCIDLTQGTASYERLDETALRAVVGGVGLGTLLLLWHGRPGVDPLADEAALVIAFSPLVGGPFTTAAKFAVVAKSPLTQRLSDGLCSSSFALAGKRTGVDALVLTGRSPQRAVLVVEDTAVRLLSADGLWGLQTHVAASALRSALGPSYEALLIGPAGENLVRLATLQHDGRHVGRGGLGAVFGAKGLKAVVVRGSQRCRVADPAGAGAWAQELARRSLGPATEKYRSLGTVANVSLLNRLGALPSRSFQETERDEAEALAGERLVAARRVERKSCAACSIGCEHRFALPNGRAVRVEYESLFALGAACDVWDEQAVCMAAARCDALGLDSISTGVALGFAMECAERGWLNGTDLRFGAGHELLGWIEQIAYRRGPVGAALADGVRHLAQQLGPEAERMAPHVKGLELPGYDPRALPLMALGLAVAARGADHNRTSAYEADLKGGDRFAPSEAALNAMIEAERRSALLDSLILCKFLRHALDPFFEDCARMLRLTTGWPVGPEELETVAERVITLRRWYNQREGWTPAEDDLPERFFCEPLQTRTLGALQLDRSGFLRLRTAYYKAHGWTADGFVPNERLAALGLDRLRVAEFDLLQR